MNSSLCDITGYSSGELLARASTRSRIRDDQEQELPLAEDLLAGRIPNYQLEKRYRPPRRDDRSG